MERRHDLMHRYNRRRTLIEVEVTDLPALIRAVESGELDPEQDRVARLLLASLMDDDEGGDNGLPGWGR